MKRLFLACTLALTACAGSTTSSNWTTLKIQNVATGEATEMNAVLKQKPTFITLWSVTCHPCRREMPWLQKISSQNAAFDVIGINIGDDIGDIKKFTSEIDVNFPMYRDELGDMLTALDVTQVPVTFAVNSQGEIVWKNLGAMTFAELQDQFMKMTM